MSTHSIESTLTERGTRYGTFKEHAQISQGIITMMSYGKNWSSLESDQRQALTTIADKIARILNGDPDYLDNWHDIQGYAKLVEDRLQEEQIAKA